MNDLLLILHFLGLAMGFSAAFGNMVVDRLYERTSPEGKAVLANFPAAMSWIAWPGTLLLFGSGIAMIYTRYGGDWNAMPWTFWVKIGGVTLLVAMAVPMTFLERRLARGDSSAKATMNRLAPLMGIGAFVALVFAVVSFG